MPHDENVVAHFDAAARYWSKYRHFIQVMFKPVTDALVEDAGVKPGHTVLDVATGPGEPALSVMDLIGPTGQIVGIDPASTMIDIARREAERMQLANAHFEVASADRVPFSAQTFDSAICRLGAMFFPSPLESLRELLRVLKPAARMAFAVWSHLERNPFQYVASEAVSKHIQMPTDDALIAFRFSQPGKFLAILNEAGGVESSERPLSFKMHVALSPAEFWEMRSHMSISLRNALARVEPAQADTIRRDVIEGTRPYSGPHGIDIPAEVLIVSCSKS